MNAFVVGLTGYAQHGKDSVANRLVWRHGYTRFAFADLLKSMALTLNPWIRFEFEEDTQVGAYITRTGVDRLTTIVNNVGWEGAKELPEVRRFLQVLGTEAVRDHLGQNTWVNATGLAIAEAGVSKAVISDARFPNEFEWCLANGTLVKVTRFNEDLTLWDNGLGTDHPSEQFIATAPAEFNIGAVTGDMEGLLKEADLIAAFCEERVTAP